MSVRMNIRVSENVKEYLEKKSIETGVSQSSIISLFLEYYIENLNNTEKKINQN